MDGVGPCVVPMCRAPVLHRMCRTADDDIRLARRIKRDVDSRGRDISSVIEQYTRFVKPSFDQFVAPSRR